VIGEREIDDLRAGGGKLAISISGAAAPAANVEVGVLKRMLDPSTVQPEPPGWSQPAPDEPRFVVIDQQGHELWSLTRWRPHAFDIDADGRFLAFIGADLDAVTLRSLHGGTSHRVEGHTVDLAFVGDYLLAVGDRTFRLIDSREGVVVGTFVVPQH
jgi:hypothetical protein